MLFFFSLGTFLEIFTNQLQKTVIQNACAEHTNSCYLQYTENQSLASFRVCPIRVQYFTQVLYVTKSGLPII